MEIVRRFCLFLLLAGCVTPMDERLLENKSGDDDYVVLVLDAYKNYQGSTDKQGRCVQPAKVKSPSHLNLYFTALVGAALTYGITLPASIAMIMDEKDYASLAEDGIDLSCLYQTSGSRYTSDECILYRREKTTADSKVCFFNYRKYLPVYNDDDFLNLRNRYQELLAKNDMCDFKNDMTLTSTEREEKAADCLGFVNERLLDRISRF